MRRVSFARIVLFAAVTTAVARAPLSAQGAPPPQVATTLGKEQLTVLAKTQVAISQAHDSVQAQLAQARNKTAQAQRQLQDKLRSEIEEILHHSGLTEEQFQHETYLVSTDPDARKTFDSIIADITGVPTPGQVAAVPAAPVIKVPAGPAGVHIGHIVNGFSDTPGGIGLLPIAVIEAGVAAQHAGLAARQPTNLDYMKTHAGHVINALDPTIVTAGPGKGYGLKKAALAIATHADLAAKAQGASPNVVMHAGHIAMSAKNTATRSDQVIAIAKQIQAATAPADAAALVSQMVSLTQQLTAGADANGDGKITWEQGEGGLQQIQEHLNLMIAAEPKTP
ncbi:MAG: hypothetical protein ABJF01_03855 [bacterium]